MQPELTDARFATQVELIIPFYDADPMGIVWHGNYLRYFEVAREQLLKQLNYGYREMALSGYSWPIVDSRVKYRHSLTFDQRVVVHAQLVEYEHRLRIDYRIVECESGLCTTKGFTIQVAVDARNQEMCFVTPPVFRQRLGLL